MKKPKRKKRTRKPNKPSDDSAPPPVQLDSKQLHMARIASAEGRLEDAQRAWFSLEKLAPNDSEPPLRLAHIYMQTGMVYDARQAIRRGLKRVGTEPLDRCRTAELLTLLDEYPLAIDLLRSVTQDKPDYARAWRVLAVALERVNRVDEALIATSYANQNDQADLQSRLVYARLLHRKGQPDNAISLLCDLLEGSIPNPQTHVSILYEQASALDTAERYVEAWEACRCAKELLRPRAARYQEAAHQTIQMCQYFSDHATAADYRYWSEQDISPLPFRLAFLVGHPRSGTTLVEKRLVESTSAIDIDEQPFIGIAVDGLINSNSSNAEKLESIRRAPRSTLEGIRKLYVRMISEHAGFDLAGGFVLDKHPEMIRYLPLLARIFPEADIIAVERDIRDVALSCYMLPVPLGQVSVSYLDIETILTRYRTIRSILNTTSEKLAKPLIKIQYESFVQQPETCLSRLMEALNWCPRENPQFGNVSKSHARSPSYALASAPTNTTRVGRWRNYEPLAMIKLICDDH